MKIKIICGDTVIFEPQNFGDTFIDSPFEDKFVPCIGDKIKIGLIVTEKCGEGSSKKNITGSERQYQIMEREINPTLCQRVLTNNETSIYYENTVTLIVKGISKKEGYINE